MHAFTQRIDKDERGPISPTLLFLIGERAGFVAPASVTRAKGKVVAEELNGFPGTILHAQLAESSLCVVSHLQRSTTIATVRIWFAMAATLDFAIPLY